MATQRIPPKRAPMCPGCGLHPHTHNWEHRLDCTAEQTPEHEALTTIAAVFGLHLTPQSAAELQELLKQGKENE